MVELKRTPPPTRRPAAAANLSSPQPTTSLSSLGSPPYPRPRIQTLIHSPQPSTSITPTVPFQPSLRQSSRHRGPPTRLGDYDLGYEEDITHRRSRRDRAADFSPKHHPGLLRPFQSPEPLNLLLQTLLISSPLLTLLTNSNQILPQQFPFQELYHLSSSSSLTRGQLIRAHKPHFLSHSLLFLHPSIQMLKRTFGEETLLLILPSNLL